ncbi:SLC13 family permease [Gordonia polyisoprenivorans]|uniref:SLC13 family permease n=1 Tax=Gordonia polyisoprenivorans TaxID=84595 RepID=UPI0030CDDF0D
MTPTQVASLVVLAGILVISILRKVNIGIVALAATLLMTTATHTDATKTLSKFPASLVILIIGVTLLFAHAERSGAINWLVEHALRWIGNRH